MREKIENSSEITVLDKLSLEQFIAAIGKTVMEKSTLPSCQVSSKTMEFDKGEEPSAYESKSTKFNLSDLLTERIVPLMNYLNRKMVKYSMSASLVGFYVELVCRRTKVKAIATTRMIERIAILTSECATATVTLQEQKEQLWAKELKCEDLRQELIAERSLRTKKAWKT